MRAHVRGPRVARREALPAHLAAVRPLARVDARVRPQLPALPEGLAADGAREGLGARVGQHVIPEAGREREPAAALLALQGPPAAVGVGAEPGTSGTRVRGRVDV